MPAMDYELPPDSIQALVDAPRTPYFTLDPTRRWALLVGQPAAPPIEEVASEEAKLGGMRFDPVLSNSSGRRPPTASSATLRGSVGCSTAPTGRSPTLTWIGGAT